jgi:hypothetical protein
VTLRLATACGVVVAGLIAAPVLAMPQAPGAAPPQADAPAAPAAADPFKFSSDAAMITWNVKADQTDAFESVWSVIRSRLQASTDPALKDLGQHLRVFRVPIPSSSKDVVYVFLADPASTTTSYSASPFLLYDSGLFERPEAEELFKLLQGSIASVTTFPLTVLK